MTFCLSVDSSAYRSHLVSVMNQTAVSGADLVPVIKGNGYGFTSEILFEEAKKLGVSRIARNLDPMSTMALAVFSYFAKLLFLGVFLYLLSAFTSRESINRTSFGATAIALTFAWLGGEIASFMKLRIHLPLPETNPKK